MSDEQQNEVNAEDQPEVVEQAENVGEVAAEAATDAADSAPDPADDAPQTTVSDAIEDSRPDDVVSEPDRKAGIQRQMNQTNRDNQDRKRDLKTAHLAKPEPEAEETDSADE